MADRKISDLTALTTPASGDFLPIVDISEVAAASKNKRITIEELMRGMPDGTAAAPSIAFESDPNTGIYSPGADQVAISTNGTGRLFVDASGSVSINTSSPGAGFDVNNSAFVRGGQKINGYFTLNAGDGVTTNIGASGGINYIQSVNGATPAELTIDANPLVFRGSSFTERMRLDSSGRLGLGTSSPQATLHATGAILSSGALVALSASNIFFDQPTSALSRIGVVGANTSTAGTLGISQYSSNGSVGRDVVHINSSGNVGIGTTTVDALLEVYSSTNGANLAKFSDAFNNRCLIVKGASGGVNLIAAEETNEASTSFGIAFSRGATEMGRFDGSGRLLVGTSTSRGNNFNTSSGLDLRLQVEGTDYLTSGASFTANSASATHGPHIVINRSRGTTIGSNTVVNSGDTLGALYFQGSDGSEFVSAADISAFVDGTPGANDMPGRLVFSTTSDGAATPTERLRITSAGVLQVADAGNITVGTTTGTKIGTATTQKIGFYNATPVVQPIAVADATDAASAITQLNALLARMRDLGLIAT
jgi:hypothetical protein